MDPVNQKMPGTTTFPGLSLSSIFHTVNRIQETLPLNGQALNERIRAPNKGCPDRIRWRAIPDETGHYWEETIAIP